MPSSSMRIVGLNLLGLLLLAAVLRANIPNGRDGIAYAVQMLVLIGMQVLANTVLAMIAKKSRRQAYWLSVLLVLLVGFGACAGGLMLY